MSWWQRSKGHSETHLCSETLGRQLDERVCRHATILHVSTFISSLIAIVINHIIGHSLTIFIRLCLIRGLITVVKLAFNPEKINVKPEARGSPCSLENFLSQWNGWLVFNSLGTTWVHRKALPYHELCNIVFSDRVTTFSHSGLGHSRHSYSFNFIES